jgi:hypothetical protein
MLAVQAFARILLGLTMQGLARSLAAQDWTLLMIVIGGACCAGVGAPGRAPPPDEEPDGIVPEVLRDLGRPDFDLPFRPLVVRVTTARGRSALRASWENSQ